MDRDQNCCGVVRGYLRLISRANPPRGLLTRPTHLVWAHAPGLGSARTGIAQSSMSIAALVRASRRTRGNSGTRADALSRLIRLSRLHDATSTRSAPRQHSANLLITLGNLLLPYTERPRYYLTAEYQIPSQINDLPDLRICCNGMNIPDYTKVVLASCSARCHDAPIASRTGKQARPSSKPNGA